MTRGVRGNNGLGIAALPGFQESLWLLIENERYSETDVALMFNVSRERIRQLCKVHGAVRAKEPRGLHAVRVWNDDLNRFIPVSRGELGQRAKARQQQERQQERDAIRAQRWTFLVGLLSELAQQLNRTPSLYELAEVLSQQTGCSNNIGTLYSFLMPHYKHRNYAAMSAALYEAVGLNVRGVGGAGHIVPCALNPRLGRGKKRKQEVPQ